MTAHPRRTCCVTPAATATPWLPLSQCPLDHPVRTQAGDRVIALHVLGELVEGYQPAAEIVRLPAGALAYPDPAVSTSITARAERRTSWVVGYRHGATGQDRLYTALFSDSAHANAYRAGYQIGAADPVEAPLAGTTRLQRRALSAYAAWLLTHIPASTPTAPA